MNNLAESDFYHGDDVHHPVNGRVNSYNLDLPIFNYRDEILQAVKNHQFVIIHGETGCGKTTQVPQFLFQAAVNENEMIGVTQPRRLSTQAVARRVAHEMNVPIGKTVGFEIRFNKKVDSSTKIKYMTDGILLNECILDHNLSNYKIILIDEAHERSVMSDVLLGLLKRVALRRVDLKVIISSATISVDKFVKYFNGAHVIKIESRLYDVKVNYVDYRSDYIRKTVELCHEIHKKEMNLRAEGGNSEGYILVFLTGQDEICDCCDELKKIVDIIPVPLCGAIDSASQQKAFDLVKPYETKVVVATNIAETGVTIDKIRYVIDCGYVKQNRYNPRRGMDILEDVRISKSQAEQRKGRAGRTQPGECYRLYSENVYKAMSDEAVSEIYRKNLSEIYLILVALNIDPEKFDFLEKPKEEEIVRSKQELIDLSLLNLDGRLRPLGQKISELPLDPTLGKVLMTSLNYQCTEDVIKIVAMFSEKMKTIFRRPGKQCHAADAKKAKFRDLDGDHFTLLNVFNEWITQNKSRKWCYEHFISADAMENVANVIKQIRNIMTRRKLEIKDKPSDSRRSDIKKCFVTGYFKNICLKQRRDSYYRVIDEEIFLIHGGSSLKNSNSKIILFHDAMKSTKNFATGVMQLDEQFLRVSFKKELEIIDFPDDVNKQLTF